MKSFEQLIKNNGQYTFHQIAESIGIPQTRAQFIPGRIYALKINSPSPNLNQQIIEEVTSGKPYLDLNPIGISLFHENWKEQALIVNFKIIPPVVLPKILEAYYAFCINNGLANLFNGEKLIPLDSRRLIDHRFYTVTPRQLGLNLNLAINKYNIEDVLEARLIDWDNFGMLVKPNFSMRGIFPETLDIERLFGTILENLNNN